MLLCIWFPSESGFLTLNSFSLGVGRRREIFMAVRSFVIEGGFTYSQTSARHTRNKEGCGWRRKGGR